MSKADEADIFFGLERLEFLAAHAIEVEVVAVLLKGLQLLR